MFPHPVLAAKVSFYVLVTFRARCFSHLQAVMPQRSKSTAKRSVGPVAAGHLAVAILVLATAGFVLIAWPQSPATVSFVPPAAAWMAWALSLAYLAATAALHFRLAFVAIRRPVRFDVRVALYALVHLPIVGATASQASLATGSNLLLGGLGHTIAALLTASVVSMALLVAAPWLGLLGGAATLPPTTDRLRDTVSVVLAVSCLLAGLATAATLAFVQLAGAAS